MPNPPMTYSDGLVAFVEAREDFSAKAYPDGKNPDGSIAYAIGFGTHVPGIGPGSTCTMQQASAWIAYHLHDDAAAINRIVTVPLEQYEFDALCSLHYNVGGQMDDSELIRLLNAGDRAGAAAQFPAWDKKHDADGNVVESPGLKARRLMEQAMFLNTPYTQQVTG